MPTTAEPIFDGAEQKMSPSNEAVKINYIGDSGARVRLLAVRSTARGEEGEKRHQKHNQIRGDQRLGQILRRQIRGDGAAWWAADDDADGMTEGVAPRGEPPCLEEQYYFTPEQATEAIAALADLWRCRDQRSDVIRGGWQGEDDARDGSAKAPNGYWWQALARTLR